MIRKTLKATQLATYSVDLPNPNQGKGSQGKGSGLEKSFFTFLLLNSFADRSVVNL